jgi:hypothetical protein
MTGTLFCMAATEKQDLLASVGSKWPMFRLNSKGAIPLLDRALAYIPAYCLLADGAFHL